MQFTLAMATAVDTLIVRTAKINRLQLMRTISMFFVLRAFADWNLDFRIRPLYLRPATNK